MTTLRWEKPPHTTGQAFVADYHGEVYEGRYYVRRQSPNSRTFVALRDGRYFASTSYASADEAKAACETDANSPNSAIKLTKGKANNTLETA